MHLIVGLGNPERQYERNRHNVGFRVADEIARVAGFKWGRKFDGELAQGSLNTEKVGILKPLTFMNLSGEAVADAARFYKIPPEGIIVFHDDLDLAPGKLRVKQGGGNGGHNGLRSIDAHIGENYWRVRIGIGHPGSRDDVTPYVLGNFFKDEWELQEKMLAAIKEAFPLLLQNDTAGFMNKVALLLNPPSPKTKPAAKI